MSDVFVAKAAEFADGDRRIVAHDGVEIGVFHWQGRYYAYQNLCIHQGGPACEGVIMHKVEDVLGPDRTWHGQRFSETEAHFVCPWHGYEYDIATGELEKATEGYKQWLQIYPRDTTVHGNLANEFMVAGKYQDAVEAERPQLAGDPSVVDFLNLAASYTGLNRFDEAQGAINDAFARQLDDPVMHENLYTLDFLRGDTTKLEHEIALSAGKPGWEDLLLSLHSNTAAFHGRINDARSLSRRAADAAHRADARFHPLDCRQRNPGELRQRPLVDAQQRPRRPHLERRDHAASPYTNKHK